MAVETFAAAFATLYAAHHVGDYWVQTDAQALGKGKPGEEGRGHCVHHVATYIATQMWCFGVMALVTGVDFNLAMLLLAMLISGVTHYMADRREYGLMFKLARKLNLAGFMKLGVPRTPQEIELWGPCPSCEGRGTSYDESTGGKCWDCKAGGMLPGTARITDNPQLATGAWALDQSWHIFWGVFVAALIISI
jgi:hypothetical protein